jgi:hypothetical protein
MAAKNLTSTSSQRDYLIALQNKKVLCPLCDKTSAIFSRQGLHLHYKTIHKNSIFSEQVLVEGDALVRQYATQETM